MGTPLHSLLIQRHIRYPVLIRVGPLARAIAHPAEMKGTTPCLIPALILLGLTEMASSMSWIYRMLHQTLGRLSRRAGNQFTPFSVNGAQSGVNRKSETSTQLTFTRNEKIFLRISKFA